MRTEAKWDSCSRRAEWSGDVTFAAISVCGKVLHYVPRELPIALPFWRRPFFAFAATRK